MFFSIIIPVYNVEKYLNQCVDSILCQTFQDFELILVDDGSKDNSSNICDEYARKDSRVKVIHQINKGQSAARNHGTRQAQGKYYIYIDSDDYISNPDFLSKVYDKAKYGADIINYKFKKFYENTGKFGDCLYEFPELLDSENYSDRIMKIIKYDAFYCSPWSKAIKAYVIKNNNIEFREGMIAEDQDWYYKVILNSNSICGINEPFLVYRQRDNSVSSSWKMKNLTDCLYVLETWAKNLENDSIDKNLRVAVYHSLAKLYCNLLIAYTNFNDSNKSKYYKNLKNLVFLLNFNINPRVSVLNKVKKIAGFGGMMFCLKIVCRLRG